MSNKNPDLQTAEELADRKMEIEDVRGEVSRLNKMLKTGFSTDTNGMARSAKAAATNDPKKITKFYAELANGLRAISLAGNLEHFNTYAAGFGVAVDAKPEISYIKKGKKKDKFQTLFNEYFLDAMPANAADAAIRILQALRANFVTIREQEESIKEESESLSYSCTKRTFSNVTNVLVSVRKKDVALADVVSELDLKVQDELSAIALLENEEDVTP